MLEGDYKYYHSDIVYIKPLVWKSDAIASVCPISNEAVIKPYIYTVEFRLSESPLSELSVIRTLFRILKS